MSTEQGRELDDRLDRLIREPEYRRDINGDAWRLHVPAYSSDFADAMQVVEELRRKGWAVLMDSDLQTDAGPAWRVALDHNGPPHFVDEVDPSLPLAICRAALAALSPSTGSEP